MVHINMFQPGVFSDLAYDSIHKVHDSSKTERECTYACMCVCACLWGGWVSCIQTGWWNLVSCHLSAYDSISIYLGSLHSSIWKKGANYNPVACITAARNSALNGSSVPYIYSLSCKWHIHKSWRQVKVTFIPLLGEVNYTEAKAYCSLNLSYFTLMMIQKLEDRNIRDEILRFHPLYRK